MLLEYKFSASEEPARCDSLGLECNLKASTSKWIVWETFYFDHSVLWPLNLYGAPVICYQILVHFNRLDTQVKLYRLLGLELQYWDARKLLNWDTVPLPLDVCLRLCSVAEYSVEEAGKVNSKILQHYSLFGLFHTLVNCEWKFIVRKSSSTSSVL